MVPDEALAELLAGNECFCTGRPRRYVYSAADRAELARGQHPIACVLCCSDARVAPEVIFDQPLGGLFVVRTPGNTSSSEALAGFEFALQNLGVGLFMVLGHTHCGAVTAAVEGLVATGAIGGVLLRIQPAVYRVPADAQNRVAAVAEQNVRATLESLQTQSMALRDAVRSGRAKLIGAMYDLEGGRVAVLE